MMRRRSIELPKGGTLEIEHSDAFIDAVKRQFMLDREPTDDDIRMFLHGAIDSAFKRALESGTLVD